MKCNKDHKHTVVYHKYNTFSYYYCKDCNEEVLQNNSINYSNLELEFNNKILSHLNEPNVVFPEYFMIEHQNDKINLIIIDRLKQTELKLSEMAKITRPYFDQIIKDYEKKNIFFNIKK